MSTPTRSHKKVETPSVSSPNPRTDGLDDKTEVEIAKILCSALRFTAFANLASTHPHFFANKDLKDKVRNRYNFLLCRAKPRNFAGFCKRCGIEPDHIVWALQYHRVEENGVLIEEENENEQNENTQILAAEEEKKIEYLEETEVSTATMSYCTFIKLARLPFQLCANKLSCFVCSESFTQRRNPSAQLRAQRTQP
jgi:hypothetical protein